MLYTLFPSRNCCCCAEYILLQPFAGITPQQDDSALAVYFYSAHQVPAATDIRQQTVILLLFVVYKVSISINMKWIEPRPSKSIFICLAMRNILFQKCRFIRYIIYIVITLLFGCSMSYYGWHSSYIFRLPICGTIREFPYIINQFFPSFFYINIDKIFW